MPSWNQILEETQNCPRKDAIDYVRRKYLRELFDVTNRNVIAYYSGWLNRPNLRNTSIGDDDKNGLMSTIYNLDKSKGLDLILHTPGGDAAATESIVDYLRKMFGTNIRAIIPQLAMSAGTMISCACKEIIMGKHSSLGPIDPQFGGIPAQGVIEEFNRALREIKEDPDKKAVWQPIISKYHPTFIGECERVIEWSKEMTRNWLESGMFKEDKNSDKKISMIMSNLLEYSKTKSHARHIPIDECEKMGLKILPLENLDKHNNLQDKILSIHHCFMITFSGTDAVKIVENHEGRALVTKEPRIVKK